MSIPVEAWILLGFAFVVWLHERGKVVREAAKKNPPKPKPRNLVIFGMSHSDTLTDYFHSGQKDVVLPITAVPTSYYLVCTTNTIDVYQSKESAEHKWDKNSISVLRLDVFVENGTERVKIMQLTSSQTGIKTNLAYGFKTIR